MADKTIRILGIRGVPAAHGGFETFAERLALFLVGRGWRVIVYCQLEGDGARTVDHWQGIMRINIPVKGDGAGSTVVFDWLSTLDAARSKEPCLILGYNTAVFAAALRLRGVRSAINMDGIEWARAKWGKVAKTWFWLNEWAGCLLGHRLIADHPAIADHLATRVGRRKITTIPYGADRIDPSTVSAAHLERFGLAPGGYFTLVARPEPENSVLEIVQGFSQQPRGRQLVVLGKYDDANAYHAEVRRAASAEVRFVGAIYERDVVQALRVHSLAYFHGHQVGGTNPSLVEALGAGNAVIAHDNKFNRWVAGDGAMYFRDATDVARALEACLADPSRLERMAAASRARFDQGLDWATVLGQYEAFLQQDG